MKLFRSLYMWMAASVMLVGASTMVSSCNDDIPSESYYTFTGEMLSDYLQNHKDFSEFSEIVTRAGKMDLFSAYGTYTCLAPTNDAVNKFMSENGYAQVSDIPVEVCDTIVRTAVIPSKPYNVVDFAGRSDAPATNMLNDYLTIQESPVLDENGDTVDVSYRFNKSGTIILTMANDSVENGIVHPVDGVIKASSGQVPDLIAENPNLSIYAMGLDVTGLKDKMRLQKDPSWEAVYEANVSREGKYPSDNHQNWCHVPKERRYGFIAFVVPDSVLEEKYGITSIEGLYEEAARRYPTEAAAYSSSAAGLADAKNPKNPLYRLMAYHMLPFNTTLDMLTTICTIDTRYLNPVEWYRTMDEMATMKLELLRLRSTIGLQDGNTGDYFVNRNVGTNIKAEQTMRGAKITNPSRESYGYENTAGNGRYFYIDDIVSFDQETKDKVFNIRMRMDLYDLFPELYSNNIRKQDTWTYYASDDKDAATSQNYLFPIGYLDNVDLNEDGDFIYQGARNWYWSYEGDEFNLRSSNDSYDITFRLPTVPTGTYQIRLGFCLIPSRGIGQFYLDGKPQGIPLDMRSNDGTWETRYGWKSLDGTTNADEREAMKKNLHNNGWYHGPKGVFNMSGSGHKDGSNSTKNSFCNQFRTIRRIISNNVTLNEDEVHTIRIKSVLALGGAELMIDYLEIVPKSVYGVEEEGAGEDDY